MKTMKTAIVAVMMMLIGTMAFAIGPSSKQREKDSLRDLQTSIRSYADFLEIEEGRYLVRTDKPYAAYSFSEILLVSIDEVDELVEENIGILKSEKSLQRPRYMKKIEKILDEKTCLAEWILYSDESQLLVTYLDEKGKVVSYEYVFQTIDQQMIAKQNAEKTMRLWLGFSNILSNFGNDLSNIANQY